MARQEAKKFEIIVGYNVFVCWCIIEKSSINEVTLAYCKQPFINTSLLG